MKKEGNTRQKLPKWLRIVIPAAVILVWLGLAGIGGPYFGKIDEVADSDLSAFLPKSSESAKVSEALSSFQTDKTIPAVLLFEAKSGELSETQVTAINTAIEKVHTVKDVSEKSSPLTKSDDGKAAFAIILIDSTGEADKTVSAVRDTLNENKVDGVNQWTTGAAGFLADLSVAFSGLDGILLLVALGVVFLILLIVYRSPLLPVIVLTVSMCALATALLLVWWLAKWDILQLNGQVQGILFILVIGATTDYSLLFVSRYREELFVTTSKWQALLNSWKGVLEPITASGGTVIVGLLFLLASDLGSNKALGPAGAIGVLFAMLAALTFLPALLYAIGRPAFWPRIPHGDKVSLAKHTAKLEKGLWHQVGVFVDRRPRAVWIVSAVLLLVAAFNLPQLKADGVPQNELILGYSEARDGQKALNKHFTEGSGSPVLILAPQTAQDSAVTVIDGDRGIDGINVTATGIDAGFKPLGKQEQTIKDEIRKEITKQLDEQKQAIIQQGDEIASQAGPFGEAARQQFLDSVLPNLPSAESLVEKAYPFKDAQVKLVDGKVLLSATLVDEPYSTKAQDTVKRLRNELETVDQSILVGGTTAINVDTNAASIHDRQIIIPLVLAAITIILMLLLRSIVAPILLLATTVLSFAASLGVAAFLFNNVWNFPGADPSVVLYGFVFLVALGIDYNIFLMTRVREESKKLGTSAGVIKGLVVTGGVITSAGVVLAATFAALSVIPILFLAQIAFVVAFGVLLDTIIVRSLLVPALIRDIGPFVWWPSKLWHKK